MSLNNSGGASRRIKVGQPARTRCGGAVRGIIGDFARFGVRSDGRNAAQLNKPRSIRVFCSLCQGHRENVVHAVRDIIVSPRDKVHERRTIYYDIGVSHHWAQVGLEEVTGSEYFRGLGHHRSISRDRAHLMAATRQGGHDAPTQKSARPRYGNSRHIYPSAISGASSCFMPTV